MPIEFAQKSIGNYKRILAEYCDSQIYDERNEFYVLFTFYYQNLWKRK